MSIRVLVLEPDEELLEAFEAFFTCSADFDVRYTADGEECISLIHRFRPDVLVLEPALPPGVADTILDAAGRLSDRPAVPVLVLTNGRSEFDDGHPSIHEFHVKPQSLRAIATSIRRLAARAE